MQCEPVIQAISLYVVHGNADRECGRCVIVGTSSYTGHVLDSKRMPPEIGYSEGMKNLVLLAAILAGCGSDPVDAEGQWMVSGTNRANDCNVNGWTENDSWSNTNVDITQNGEAVIVDITGGGGFALDIFLGGNDVFRGDVDGNDLHVTRQGTRSNTTGNCTFTYNATIDATINGNTLEGTISYRPAHNGNSDCAAVECENIQEFSGNRAPQ